jgi:kynurenine formamidase
MSRIIDLTLPLRSGDRGVSFETARRLETDGWNAMTLHLYSHCGTHMDAPPHFGIEGPSIDQFPLEQLIGPAWVADARPAEPQMLIEPRHIEGVAASVATGDGLLICTDWSRQYGREVYRDGLPRISEGLAEWCVDTGVRILGVESPAIADVNNRDELTKIHHILLEAGVIIVEGLTNLNEIAGRKVTFIALPLKVAGGDGAPVRAIAIDDAVE